LKTCWRVKDTRPRAILTEFGEVAFSRRVYIDEFVDRRTYLDEILSLSPEEATVRAAASKLSDHLHGPKIVHKLDPRHVNRAVKTAFPTPKTQLRSSICSAQVPTMGTMEGTCAHLPVPQREQTFKLKDRRRREAIANKRRYAFSYEMVHSDGKEYEPPAGHLMPFSTRQQFLAMFGPWN